LLWLLVKTERGRAARQRRQQLDAFHDAPDQCDVAIELPRCMADYDVKFLAISALRRAMPGSIKQYEAR
jgi:hypothetical protein